jgi:hypothetical protein
VAYSESNLPANIATGSEMPKVSFSIGSTIAVSQLKKTEKVIVSNRLLEISFREEKNNFHNLVTSDESWFF